MAYSYHSVPKTKYHYKVECHKLIEKIWGPGREGRNQAYTWLSYKFGKKFHFATTHNMKMLKEVYQTLWAMSLQKRKVVGKVKPRKPVLMILPSSDPEKILKKQKALEYKKLAPNVRELQKMIGERNKVIIRKPFLVRIVIHMFNNISTRFSALKALLF